MIRPISILLIFIAVFKDNNRNISKQTMEQKKSNKSTNIPPMRGRLHNFTNISMDGVVIFCLLDDCAIFARQGIFPAFPNPPANRQKKTVTSKI
jgi:hypothetical protein